MDHRCSAVAGETARYDSEAVSYLSYVMVPILVGFSAYSLVYQSKLLIRSMHSHSYPPTIAQCIAGGMTGRFPPPLQV